MQRYDYAVHDHNVLEAEPEAYDTKEDYLEGISCTLHRETVFEVFDRKRGCNAVLATCNDREDAELIVRALTALETLAKPLNHNTIENPMEIAA